MPSAAWFFVLARLGAVWMLALVAALATGCTSLSPNGSRQPSHALDRPQDTTLGRNYALRLAEAPGHSGLHLLASGTEAFAARAMLAAAAERTLDLQYHIVERDTTATLLIFQAVKAARRGVRVRLLIDDIQPGFDDADLTALAAHPNIEIRLFNPFALRAPLGITRLLELMGSSARLNRRMHNKLWIADNAVVVLGGRNLGNAYFDTYPDSSFADLDLLVAGPVVPSISSSFDHFWNSSWSVPVETLSGTQASDEDFEQATAEMDEREQEFRRREYAEALRATRFRSLLPSARLPLITALTNAVFDLPHDMQADAPGKREQVFAALRSIVETARSEVLLVSPYFVPNELSIQVLCALPLRGVRVRVLTNSLASTDVPIVHAGYSRYRPRMLACGIELHEMRPATARATPSRSRLSSGSSLHAKAVVVDRRFAFIGSMNLDPRSRQLNTELALRADSDELGQQLGALFDTATLLDQAFKVELDDPADPGSALLWKALEGGQPQTYTYEPLASAWRRIYVPILGALTPESLL